MSNLMVNVFSKQARFQDLGPIPSNAGDLKGWPITNHFLSFVNFPTGNLCAILWWTFSRNRRGFRTCDQFHRMQGTCEGGQSQRIFFQSLIFKLEIYVQFCGQRFLETGEVSGPRTNPIECRGHVGVANRKGFSFYRWFPNWKFLFNSVVNVFSKHARFQDLGPIPSNAGDLKGCPIRNHFLSFVNFEAGQRFLETGEVSGPATNSIECRGPARVANHAGFY